MESMRGTYRKPCGKIKTDRWAANGNSNQAKRPVTPADEQHISRLQTLSPPQPNQNHAAPKRRNRTKARKLHAKASMEGLLGCDLEGLKNSLDQGLQRLFVLGLVLDGHGEQLLWLAA
jgi:hypothetical protein